MKIKLIKNVIINRARQKNGAVIEVGNNAAKNLIERGLAEEVKPEAGRRKTEDGK